MATGTRVAGSGRSVGSANSGAPSTATVAPPGTAKAGGCATGGATGAGPTPGSITGGPIGVVPGVAGALGSGVGVPVVPVTWLVCRLGSPTHER